MEPTEHPAAVSPEALLAQCSFRTTRRSGPGGQHRNKVETAVILTHEPTGVRAEANERRSQADNREQALQRLRVELALRIRIARENPSALWRRRVSEGKLKVNPSHQDFPALLAELLDFWLPRQEEFGELAERLGTTASQLIKFLKLEPRALAMVNQARSADGKRPYQ